MTIKKTKKRAGEGSVEAPKKVQKKVVGDVAQQAKKPVKPNNKPQQQQKDKKPEAKVAVQQKKKPEQPKVKPVKSEKQVKPENGITVDTKSEDKKGDKKTPGWRYTETKKRGEMSVETLAQKIEEIRSRPELTRSAKRKLSAFKKLLAVKQGTYVSKQNLPKKKDKKKPPQPTVQTTESKAPTVKPNKVEAKKQQLAKKQQQKVKPVQPEPESDEDESMSEEEEETHKSKLPKFKGTLQGKQPKQEESDEDESDLDEEEEDSEANDDSFEAIVGRNPALKDGSEDSDDDMDEEESDDVEGEESDDEEMDESAENEDEMLEDEEGEEESESEEEVKPAKTAAKPKPQPKVPAKQSKVPAKQAPQASPDQSGKKKRFVLFVGNLSYTTTADEIRKHFSVKIGKIQDVRIPGVSQEGKHKGFAYVEVTNPTDYEKGLSLHNTFISGRKINVQYSDSGHKGSGKKSEVVAKNKKLQALRQAGKLAGSNKSNQNRKDRRNKQKN